MLSVSEAQKAMSEIMDDRRKAYKLLVDMASDYDGLSKSNIAPSMRESCRKDRDTLLEAAKVIKEVIL